MTTLSDRIDSEKISSFGDIFSTELAQVIDKDFDFLQLVCAVGEIAPIMVGLPGILIPNPNIWQECNGSEITNENSPLRSMGSEKRYTPNLVERYLMITPSGGQVAGTYGGENDTWYFKHNHGGTTTTYNPPGDVDEGGNAWGGRSHAHGVNFDFQSSKVNVEPPFFGIKFYMRIQ